MTPLEHKRKLYICSGAIVLATLMLWLDRLTGDNWVDFCSLALMAFVAGNMNEHWSKRNQ